MILSGATRGFVFEGRNIRHLEAEDVGEKIDIATIDVSFSSLKKVIPKLGLPLEPDGRVFGFDKTPVRGSKGKRRKGGGGKCTLRFTKPWWRT